MPVSQIKWGAALVNTLTFEYPLHAVTTDREPREGSEWAVSPSGTRDAWIVGHDYTMECDVVYIRNENNIVTDPENFGAWSNIATPVLTSGQTDPFGGTAAYLIEDNDGALLEGKSQSIPFVGSTIKAMAVYVRQGTSSKFGFGIHDTTAATYRLLIDATWSGGVPVLSISGGSGTTTYPVVDAGGGWYRVAAASNIITAANAHTVRIFPVDISTGASTGTTYFFGANAWNGPTATTYGLTAISGAKAWQDFLDWCRGANSFRFIPDATLTATYIDPCYLADPMRGFGTMDASLGRTVKIKLINPTYDFHKALLGALYTGP
jgi:hypothetical protein